LLDGVGCIEGKPCDIIAFLFNEWEGEMNLDWKTVSSGLVGGVLLAVLLGLGTLSLNGIEDGWVVRHLFGGVTKADLAKIDEVTNKTNIDLTKLQNDQIELAKQVSAIGKAIVYSAVRFGERGHSGVDLDEGPPFIKADTGRHVASSKYYPLCFVSHIKIGGAGSCEIEQKADWWEVTITGDAACKVTCFRAQTAE
jgi:hypothetical protein